MSPQTSAISASPGAASAPGARRLPGRFWLLTCTHGVNDMYGSAVPAILPFLVAERNYSYAAATGITVAATALSSVVQPLFGHLADRRPMGWLISVGMLVAGLGVGLSGLVDSYALTWLAIAVSGIGLAAYHPAGAQAARRMSGGSSHVIGIFQMGGSAGGAVAPLLVAATLGATGVAGTWLLALPAIAMFAVYRVASARSAARETAMSPTAVAALAAPGATAPGATAPGATAPGATAPGAPATGRDDWHAFRRLSAVVVCWSIPYVGVSSFVALFAIDRFGVSETAGSVALTAFVVCGALGTLAGGWLADRHGRLRVVRGGYALALPAAVALVAAPAFPVLLAATALTGFALFLPFAAQVTLGQDYLPDRIATASGVTLGLALSVGGLLAPVFGVIADARGLTATLAALLAFVAVAGGASLLLREPRR
jgi:FSR family fosmidomycin resistance protein-like MFS transporter